MTAFEDVLAVASSRSYLSWLTFCWEPFWSNYEPYASDGSALQWVLDSAAVQQELASCSDEDRSSARDRISDIIGELSHNYSPRSIPHLGYLLTRILRALYRHVYVDTSAVKSLFSADGTTNVPTLYLPTHRSYMDFIVLPWVCFNYGLQLPVVAAAIDFSAMAVVSRVMRRCGAFFIRRRVKDRLYAAVLRCYVQHLALTCALPVQFFVEGTRSRSGKPLSPKTGLLQVFLDLLQQGLVPDVRIVPVAISYDRLLEENVFAREMLGVPKPKESTSALFRALGVLSNDYGRVFVKFHAPISVRQSARRHSSLRLALSVLQCHALSSHHTCAALLASACLLLVGTSVEPQPVCFATAVRLARFIASNLSLQTGACSSADARFAHLSVDDVSERQVAACLAVNANLFRRLGDQLHLASVAELSGLLSGDTDEALTSSLNWTFTLLRLQCYSNCIVSAVVCCAVQSISSLVGGSWSLPFLANLLSLEFPLLAGLSVYGEAELAAPVGHASSTAPYRQHSQNGSASSFVFHRDQCGCAVGATWHHSQHCHGGDLAGSRDSRQTEACGAEISAPRQTASDSGAEPVCRVCPKEFSDEAVSRSLLLPYLRAYSCIVHSVHSNVLSTEARLSVRQLQVLLHAQLTSCQLSDQRCSACCQLVAPCHHLIVSQDVVSNCLNSLTRFHAANKHYSDNGTPVYGFSSSELTEVHEKLSLVLSCCSQGFQQRQRDVFGRAKL